METYEQFRRGDWCLGLARGVVPLDNDDVLRFAGDRGLQADGLWRHPLRQGPSPVRHCGRWLPGSFAGPSRSCPARVRDYVETTGGNWIETIYGPEKRREMPMANGIYEHLAALLITAIWLCILSWVCEEVLAVFLPAVISACEDIQLGCRPRPSHLFQYRLPLRLPVAVPVCALPVLHGAGRNGRHTSCRLFSGVSQ